MKLFSVTICFLLLFGCGKKIVENDLKNLNGYWEIAKVKLPNGETKEYTVNPTVDYIELDAMKGFRKKLQPKFNGTYSASDDADRFTIKKIENQFIIIYINSLTAREEQLIALSKDAFTVKNSENISYFYKRYKPININ